MSRLIQFVISRKTIPLADFFPLARFDDVTLVLFMCTRVLIYTNQVALYNDGNSIDSKDTILIEIFTDVKN